MKIIKQTYNIHAPIFKVWQAPVIPKKIDAAAIQKAYDQK